MKHSVNHRPWVNFKELRARLKSEEVLRLYKVEVKRKGEQHQGPCPLPGHTGSRNWPSFSVNLERGIFQCFGCKAKGNILEFAALMEGVNVADGDALRNVAVKLQKEFFSEGASTRTKERFFPESAPDRTEPLLIRDTPPEPGSAPVVVNASLDFELKGLDRAHDWFAANHFAVGTMQRFGVGFCARGMLQGRIAIPLHNPVGERLGYAGLEVDQDGFGPDESPYVFPLRREHAGTIYELCPDRFLYNGHRFPAPREDLAVVEWFPSVWWLAQNGFPNVVATMGKDCSPEQAELIVSLVRSDGRVWMLPDGGEERLALSVFRQVAARRAVRWVHIPKGKTPTDLSAMELKACYAR